MPRRRRQRHPDRRPQWHPASTSTSPVTRKVRPPKIIAAAVPPPWERRCCAAQRAFPSCPPHARVASQRHGDSTSIASQVMRVGVVWFSPKESVRESNNLLPPSLSPR
ncbi:hypothetical protein VTO73DRAFT_1924 [Trametes versicolor]